MTPFFGWARHENHFPENELLRSGSFHLCDVPDAHRLVEIRRGGVKTHRGVKFGSNR